MKTLELISPYLQDFKNNELIFEEAFIQNKKINKPINTICELGVHRGENIIFGGQSTKSLYHIYNTVGFETLYSLDLDPYCIQTINIIRNMFLDNGFLIPEHEFICCNSIEYYPDVYFDLVFIDTNHDSLGAPEYGGKKEHCGVGHTFKEIMHYKEMLTTNGRIFLHDTKNLYVSRFYGHNVEGACVKFINENPEWAFIEHNTNEHGLGELIRKDSDIFNHLISFDEKYRNWEDYFKNHIKIHY